MKKSFIILLLFLLLFSCKKEEEIISVSPDPQITEVRIDTVWNIIRSANYPIEAVVEDSRGPASIQSVTLVIVDESDATVYETALYDEGSVEYPMAGDVFANDGIFRNQFSATHLGAAPATYQFHFLATDTDNNSSGLVIKEVELIKSAAPVILSVQTPDSVVSGPLEHQFAVLLDNQGGKENMGQVGFHIYNADKSVLLDTKYIYQKGGKAAAKTAELTSFVYLTDSTFAIAKKGWHVLEFFAMDVAGQASNMVDQQVYIENSAGTIHYTDVEDSLQRPSQPGIFNESLIRVNVSDPQGLADVDSVHFYSKKPDGSYANSGNPFVLVDNGLPFNLNNWKVEAGDEVAGDGIFSFTMVVSKDNDPGTYTFEFYMRDKAGNLTIVKRETIEVI